MKLKNKILIIGAVIFASLLFVGTSDKSYIFEYTAVGVGILTTVLYIFSDELFGKEVNTKKTKHKKKSREE